MDRYLTEWQLRNYEQGPYYNYPTSGYEVGANLHDVISPEAPFVNIFDEDRFNKSKPLTIKDVYDGTTFLDAPYVYDTILELIQGDVADEPTSTTIESDPDRASVYVVCDVVFLSLLLCFVF